MRIAKYFSIVWKYLFWTLAVSLLTNILFVILSVAVTLPEPTAVRTKLYQAFMEGSLTIEEWPMYTRGLPWDEFSDCNLLSTVIMRTNVWEDAAWPISHSEGRAGCASLFDVLANRPLPPGWHRPSRYWFGARIFPAAFLPLMSYRHFMLCLMLMYYLVPIGIGATLLFYGHTRAFYALTPVLAGISLFSGGTYFSQSAAHAPSVISASLMLLALVCVYIKGLRFRTVLLLACFCGSIQMFYETMLGGIALGSALIIGPYAALFALKKGTGKGQPLVIRTTLLLVSFSIGALTASAGKILFAAPVIGLVAAYKEYIVSFTYRAGGDSATLAQAWPKLLTFRYVLWGSDAVGTGVLCAGALFWIIALGTALWFWIVRRNMWRLAFLSCMVIACTPSIAWLLLLRNHIVMHAWMDVRILTWITALGCTAVWFSLPGTQTRKAITPIVSTVPAVPAAALARPGKVRKSR